jgi:PhzF family phenazine biosynthesis protein
MRIKIYQVDAFTDKVFSGNPAAVCPLQEWLSDEIMQDIAMENNLAETAFYVKRQDEYEIRWFTPTIEVDLCGHATLAAAFVLFNHENHHGEVIRFTSARSGLLTVQRIADTLTLNFPADDIKAVDLSDELMSLFTIKPISAFKGRSDYMLVFQSQDHIEKLVPDFEKIAKLKARGLIATAKGDNADFVSRFFAPQSGIDEDPVTGSAHTTLTQYWAGELGRNEFTAVQLSKRKGYLQCRLAGNGVEISGKARLYLKGEIVIN